MRDLTMVSKEKQMRIATLQTMRYCEFCEKQALHIYDNYECNHLLHLFLTLITSGLWLIIWFLVVIGNGRTNPVCTVCGGVMPEEMRLRLEAERKLRAYLAREKRKQLLKNISEFFHRFIIWSDRLSDETLARLILVISFVTFLGFLFWPR